LLEYPFQAQDPSFAPPPSTTDIIFDKEHSPDTYVLVKKVRIEESKLTPASREEVKILGAEFTTKRRQ
jgi:hypothetical protein